VGRGLLERLAHLYHAAIEMNAIILQGENLAQPMLA
jgi:hypothetical protein